jgi:uncharacterized repeat protein (TIGR01451 family)
MQKNINLKLHIMKKSLLLILLFLSSFAMAQTTGLIVGVNRTNATCFGQCNGMANAAATGGVGPYGYSYYNPNGLVVAAQTANNLCAGSYTVAVVDSSNMATAYNVFTITQPTQLMAQTSGQTQQICAGGCAQLYVSVTGGTAPYTFNWTPATSLSSSTIQTPLACPTSSTAYFCTVLDANGCTNSSTNTLVNYVLVQSNILVSATSNPATCGQCNGSASATVSGTTTNTTYSWVGPNGYTSTQMNLSGLCGGNYTVTANSSNGCAGTASVNVANVSTIVSASITTTAAGCNSSNGTITIANISGGVSPYVYYINGTPYTISTIGNLPAGTYQVEIRDGNQCTYVTSATIQSTSGLSVVVDNISPAGCNSLATGSATIHAIGGTSPYSYGWASAGQTGSQLVNVPAGNYMVQITDAGGCSLNYSVVVPSTGAPTVVLDYIININCQNASTGTIAVHGSGGVAPYTYLWNNGATTSTASGLQAGGYYVYVTDANGCSGIHTYQIQNTGNLYLATQTTFANCGSNGTGTITATGGTPPYTYTWSNGQTIGTGTSANNLYGAAIYTVTVTDASGCTASGSVYVQNLCYNVIRGTVYNDLNGNCIRDLGEPAVNTSLYARNGAMYTGYGSSYNSNGNYTIYTQSMNNQVSLGYLPLYTSQTCPAAPATQPANFTNLGDTINGVDFAVQIMSNINDLQVVFYPSNARPGFQQMGYLYYYNVGTNVMNNVSINLTHDSILTFNTSSPASTSYTYPTNTWNIGTLNPGQSGYIYVYYTVPLIANGGYIGRVLNYTAQINPIAGDYAPSDNVYLATRVISNSYDPNDKSVLPAGDITVADTMLHYTINFQNTGNDTAFTVVVKDTLSPYVDIASVQPGLSSHLYEFSLSFNGEMTFRFNNILLVDSTTNEPLSHGFVNYSVRSKASNPIGTNIQNTAYIYFDFNDAIITNTTSNMLVTPTAVGQFQNSEGIAVYPNPFSDYTVFTLSAQQKNASYNFELTNVLGQKVKEQNNITGNYMLHRNGLENGVYFYRIYNAQRTISTGKLIVK